jgi:DNA-binding IclR family transcriptional regulator
MNRQINNSVVKAFAILHLIDEVHPVITAADVTRQLGMNGVTAHRFLKTLEHVGALVPVRKGAYRLGYALVDLGDQVMREDTLGGVLQPILDGITADLQEASMATIFQGDMVVCIARAVSNRTISVEIRVGTRLEAYCTAHGKLWLTHMNPRERDRYLKQVQRMSFTDRTLVDRHSLEKEFEQIRQTGRSVNDGEREDGIRAVAVPVINRSGKMIAGLSVFGPVSRFSDDVLARAHMRLKQGAADAERALYGDDGKPVHT